MKFKKSAENAYVHVSEKIENVSKQETKPRNTEGISVYLCFQHILYRSHKGIDECYGKCEI